MWQGIEKKEVRAQITATQVVVIDNGSPYALPPRNLCLSKTYIRSPTQTGIDVARDFVTRTCWAGSFASRPSGVDQEDQPGASADPSRSWGE